MRKGLAANLNPGHELVGRKFVDLTVLSREANCGKERAWLCLCVCGKQKVVSSSSLTRGRTRSCGCLASRQRQKRTPSDFWAWVDRGGPNDCWPWKRCTNGRFGHGLTYFNGTKILSHRLAFQLHFGYLPPFVCHHCDNPPCCNPAHLFAAESRDENNKDRAAKGRNADTRGENSPTAKLTNEIVRSIRKDYVPRRGAVPALAIKYNLSITHVRDIVIRKSWRHLE